MKLCKSLNTVLKCSLYSLVSEFLAFIIFVVLNRRQVFFIQVLITK